MNKIIRLTPRPAPLPSEATKKQQDDDSSKPIRPARRLSIKTCPEQVSR
jgi:hypothetical protein